MKKEKNVFNKRFTINGAFVKVYDDFEGIEGFFVRPQDIIAYSTHYQSYFNYEKDNDLTDLEEDEWLEEKKKDGIDDAKTEGVLSITILFSERIQQFIEPFMPNGEAVYRYWKSESYDTYQDDLKTLDKLKI